MPRPASQGAQYNGLTRVSQGLVAVRDFELAYRRFGSFAPVSGWAARPSMSAAPPIATENSRRAYSSRCARRRPEQGCRRRTSAAGLVCPLLARQHDKFGRHRRFVGAALNGEQSRLVGLETDFCDLSALEQE